MARKNSLCRVEAIKSIASRNSSTLSMSEEASLPVTLSASSEVSSADTLELSSDMAGRLFFQPRIKMIRYAPYGLTYAPNEPRANDTLLVAVPHNLTLFGRKRAAPRVLQDRAVNSP